MAAELLTILQSEGGYCVASFEGKGVRAGLYGIPLMAIRAKGKGEVAVCLLSASFQVLPDRIL